MRTIVLASLVLAVSSLKAFAGDGAGLPASAQIDRPFRALFAAHHGNAGDPDDATALADAIRASGVGSLETGPASPAPRDADSPSWSSSSKSITWGPLLAQSVSMLVFQHWFRATFEDGTWAATVEGPFWDDYVNSVKGLCCWDDGDKGTTNWLFHPMLGSVAAFLFSNNHRDSQLTAPGNHRDYWTVKGKQLAFSFAYSTYFELGPLLSEAAIGNVGLDYSEMTWKDIIVTPTLGTAFSIGEDLLRVHVIDKVDRKNHFWGATLAIFLNPTRSAANLFALKVPWSGPEWLERRREADARPR